MDSSPFIPPASEIIAPVEHEFSLASRSQRFGGAMVDGLTFCLFLVPLYVSLSVGEPRNWVIMMVIMFIVIIGINCYLLNSNGQSIGKKMMGTKIVRSNGERAGFWRIVIYRNVSMWILSLIPFVGSVIGIVDALMIFRENHQCLHDDIASTIVIIA